MSCNELALPGGIRIGACLLKANALGDHWAFYRKGEQVVIEEAVAPEVRHHSTERDVQPGAVPTQGTFHRRE